MVEHDDLRDDLQDDLPEDSDTSEPDGGQDGIDDPVFADLEEATDDTAADIESAIGKNVRSAPEGATVMERMKQARLAKGPIEAPRLPQDIEREVDRLLSAVTVPRDGRGYRRMAGMKREDVIRLSRAMRLILEHGGSLRRDLEKKVGAQLVTIHKAQRRFQITLLTPHEMQILKTLKEEAEAQSRSGKKISWSTRDLPKRGSMVILRRLLRIQRDTSGLCVLQEQLRLKSTGLNAWEKKYRGKTMSEIAPDLFRLPDPEESVLLRLQNELGGLRGSGEETCKARKTEIVACRKLLKEKSAVRPLIAMSAELNVPPETLDAWDEEAEQRDVRELLPEYFPKPGPATFPEEHMPLQEGAQKTVPALETRGETPAEVAVSAQVPEVKSAAVLDIQTGIRSNADGQVQICMQIYRDALQALAKSSPEDRWLRSFLGHEATSAREMARILSGNRQAPVPVVHEQLQQPTTPSPEHVSDPVITVSDPQGRVLQISRNARGMVILLEGKDAAQPSS